ncbi:MAG: metallophosphoesterase family protein [Ruminococcus sp.]|nr:metallophosphoesterase family protein [Ruminococcus sp.]
MMLQRRIFYIADMHFGHKNILKYDKWPFADTGQMDAEIIRRWNERVGGDDTVYVLGDAFFKGEERSIEIMQRLNGHKRLIRGNHDRNNGKLLKLWESVSEYEEIKDGEHLVVLSHYPMLFYNHQHDGAVMLYGHVHNTREWELVEKWQQELWQMDMPARLINVGCMMDYMDYAPRTLDELLAPATISQQKQRKYDHDNRILQRGKRSAVFTGRFVRRAETPL